MILLVVAVLGYWQYQEWRHTSTGSQQRP